MTRIPVTSDEMREAIEQVHLALPKYGLTNGAIPQLVRVYREALEGFDGETVRGAAKMLLKSAEKFPSPSLWRETCITWLKHNRIVLERQPEVDRDGNDIVCPVCRSVARWAILKMFAFTPGVPRRTHEGIALADGETLRRIAVCDPDRHHTPHGITPLPPNFLRWEN